MSVSPGIKIGPSPLTLARTKAMLTELALGYSTKGFQKKLDELIEVQYGAGLQEVWHVDGRKELALTVQREVLPRYGFESNASGVNQMVKAIRPLLFNHRIAEQSEEIRRLLKLPPKSYGDSDSSDEEAPNGFKKLRREKAVALQSELLAGYSAPDFQTKLRKLMRKDPDNMREERRKLVRAVQAAVLPKYGFVASDEGLEEMKEAFEDWQWDTEVRNLGRAIEEQLETCMTAAIAERAGHSAGPVLWQESISRSTSGSTTASSSLGATPQPAQVAESKPKITRDETRAMLQELLEGFSTDEFKWKMMLLKQAQRSRPGDGYYMDGVEELALSVQRKVLPKFGFEGSRRGVLSMICEASNYLSDHEVAELHDVINEKLGMDTRSRMRFKQRLSAMAKRGR